jgi:hypothetical protein
MAPRVPPAPLHDEARGRAMETRSAEGVTERSRLRAAIAAPRVGLAATFAPRASPSVPVEGRAHRAEEPEAEVMHRTRGDSRAHRRAGSRTAGCSLPLSLATPKPSARSTSNGASQVARPAKSANHGVVRRAPVKRMPTRR